MDIRTLRLALYAKEKKAELSKRQFLWRAKISNVRGLGTFFDTYLNLPHLFACKFKNQNQKNQNQIFLFPQNLKF